jgi:serine/threonine protein kinase, bacterial
MTSSDDDTGADQTATAAAENDATSVVPPPTEAAPELAWSEDDGDADDAQPWREAWGRASIFVFVAALMAFAIAVVGWFAVRAHHNHPVASTPSTTAAAALPPIASAPPAPTGPTLDGAYQLTFDAAASTYRGGTSPKRSGIRTIWWAFRSSCTPAGCTASGVKLDDTDHSVRSAKNITDTFTYVDGQWEDAPIPVPDTVAPGCPRDSNQWTMRPQPDGTLAGIETITIEGTCGSAGNATITPFTATRIGPVPAGAFPID